jgi:hypothetical protein
LQQLQQAGANGLQQLQQAGTNGLQQLQQAGTNGLQQQLQQAGANALQQAGKNAVQQLGLPPMNGIDFPSLGFQKYFVELIDDCFTHNEKKEYTQIREEIYKKVIDTIKSHLRSPEGRQMILRHIEPEFKQSIQEILVTKEILFFSFYKIIKISSKIKSLLIDELAYAFTNDTNDTNNVNIIRVFTKNLKKKLREKITLLNPMKKLYEQMTISGFEDSVINSKIKTDIEKSICSTLDDIHKKPSTSGGKLFFTKKKHTNKKTRTKKHIIKKKYIKNRSIKKRN